MINLIIPTIKNHTSSLDTIVKSNEKETLGRVLSFVSSSHSAVFIYNDNEEFQGLVSPYKTIYYHNYPYETPASSIIIRPPKIRETAKFYEVAKHMIATKIYVLPVFSMEDELIKVIHGKEMMLESIKDPNLLTFIKNNVRLHNPITIPANSMVNDVFNTLKEKNYSRLILVSDSGAIEGIVTRNDLMQAVISPTSKMRTSNEGTLGGYNSYIGEKKWRKDVPVRKFSTNVVSHLPDNTPMEKIITYLVTSSRNSVVLVNEDRIPTGFLSTRDILKAIALMKPKEEISIQIKRPSKNVSDFEIAKSIKYLKTFGLKLNKRIEIKRIRVITDEPKNPKGHTHEFNTTVTLITAKGEDIISSTKNRSFFDGIQEASKQIEKQQRRKP
jgi:predicted transcriptional regulator